MFGQYFGCRCWHADKGSGTRNSTNYGTSCASKVSQALHYKFPKFMRIFNCMDTTEQCIRFHSAYTQNSITFRTSGLNNFPCKSLSTTDQMDNQLIFQLVSYVCRYTFITLTSAVAGRPNSDLKRFKNTYRHAFDRSSNCCRW